LFKKLTEDNKGKQIVAVIELDRRLYTLTFNDGRLEKVDEEETVLFLTKLLTHRLC